MARRETTQQTVLNPSIPKAIVMETVADTEQACKSESDRVFGMMAMQVLETPNNIQASDLPQETGVYGHDRTEAHKWCPRKDGSREKEEGNKKYLDELESGWEQVPRPKNPRVGNS